jgi:hypothetical protein
MQFCLKYVLFTFNILTNSLILIAEPEGSTPIIPKNTTKYLRALNTLKMTVFWAVVPCSPVEVPTFQRSLLPPSSSP